MTTIKKAISLVPDILMRGLVSLGTILFNIFLIRTLTISEYGTFMAMFSFVIGASIFARFGTENLILKFSSISFSKKDYSNYYFIKKLTLLLTLMLSILILLIVFFFNYSISSYLLKIDSSTLYYFSFLIPLLTYIYLQRAYLRSLKKNKISIITEIGAIHFLSTIILLIFYIFNIKVNIFLILNVFIFSSIFLIVTSEVLKAFFEKMNFKNVLDNIAEEKLSYFSTLRTLIDYFLVSVSIYIFLWLPLVVLKFYGFINEVAYYTSAYSLTLFINFFYVAIINLFAPDFAIYYDKKDQINLQVKVSESVKLMAIYALPFLIFLLVFSKYIVLFIYGDQYLGIVNILTIFLIVEYFCILLGPSAMILAMTEYSKINTKINFLFSTIFLIMLIFLTPYYSILGAVISYTVCIIGKNLVCSYYVKKLVNISPYIKLNFNN